MGYETLVAEVNTNISWRLFCRLGLASQVPDASTLSKLTKGKAKAAVAQLNDALLTKLAEQDKVKGRRVRTDTTVLPANIIYPTDIGLLADGLRVIGRNLAKLRGLGTVAGAAVEAMGKQMEQARAKVKEQLRRLSQRLKRKDRPAGVRQEATQAVLEVAQETVEQVTAALAKVQMRELGRTERRLAKAVLDGLAVVRRLVEQTKQVLSGNPHVKNRVVSIFDREARPIRKGKLKMPTEFGRTIRVDQSEDGYITGYAVHVGSPGDSTQVVPAVEHHRTVFGRVPEQVAADRGMGCPTNDCKLAKLGVKDICFPQPGPLSDARKARESEPTFEELKKWRAGVEALISLMKRSSAGTAASFTTRQEPKHGWIGRSWPTISGSTAARRRARVDGRQPGSRAAAGSPVLRLARAPLEADRTPRPGDGRARVGTSCPLVEPAVDTGDSVVGVAGAA
ncbi:MAG: transposase [Chloroflexota bacterium]|nr:transposase [Chloroflexota bacterium]